jgi:hypothetical protein
VGGAELGGPRQDGGEDVAYTDLNGEFTARGLQRGATYRVNIASTYPAGTVVGPGGQVQQPLNNVAALTLVGGAAERAEFRRVREPERND